ncbi:MAG: uncharacterized protein JWN07_3359 [Hyphomicrobiales bacterium]|nr:uncharacterized protein [Hyphomicrobiales bacterium]
MAMRRIIYLNPFSATNITGGIKTAHRQVELLCELGYSAFVWQPAGDAAWMTSKAPLVRRLAPGDIRPEDVLIFPEVLHVEGLHPFMALRNGCLKLLFCQNQFYAFNDLVPRQSYEGLGFDGVFCCSVASRDFLRQVLHVKDPAIIPCFVDPLRFRPHPKKLQVLAIASKLQDKAYFIAQCLRAKHRDVQDVPLVFVRDKSEDEVARLMGESAVLLALGNRESFGLVALEAMAAGCLVVGFHGYGGLEYADRDNGLWFWADQEEAVADALYRLIVGARNGEVWTRAMTAAASATAERYNRARTRDALLGYFSALGVRPGA